MAGVDVLVLEQPDLEAHVWQQVQDLHPTAWVLTVAHDSIGWHLVYTVQVDVRAGTRTAARRRAETARQRMLQLPTQPWADGCVTFVQPADGPFWLPDDDGCPRFVARYEVGVHPAAVVPAQPPGIDGGKHA